MGVALWNDVSARGVICQHKDEDTRRLHATNDPNFGGESDKCRSMERIPP